MKKLTILLTAAAVLLPTLTLAAGQCGFPPTSNPNFCHCFLKTSKARCVVVMHSTLLCSEVAVKIAFMTAKGPYSSAYRFCKYNANKIPRGITTDECAQDIQYYNQHC